jgi:hypothetical protein
MPELGYRPTNKYLPPRSRAGTRRLQGAPDDLPTAGAKGFLGWLDRLLSD